MGTLSKIVMLIIFSLIEFRTIKGAETNYGPCQAANGASGDCIEIRSCPALNSLIMKGNLGEADLIFLRNSQCGWNGKNPLVCCPKPVASSSTNTFQNPSNAKRPAETNYGPCQAANGASGDCIEVRSCPALNSLIMKRQLAVDELTFLRNSRCGSGTVNTLVCCPKTFASSSTNTFQNPSSATRPAESDDGSCQTAYGASGDCTAIQSCPALYSLAVKPILRDDEKKLLTNSQCGMNGRYVLVCCPKSVVSSQKNLLQNPAKPITSDKACETPNGIKGNCISARECDSILPLIKANITPNERNFLTRSRCGDGFAQVCCPDPPPSDRGELPLPPSCGPVSLTKRLFGGTATDIDEFPWTALIIYSNGNGSVGRHCGGSLINERYVVTTAHCVGKQLPSQTFALTGVRLGEWNTATERDCQIDSHGNSLCATPHLDVSVAEQIIHPQYDAGTQANDIALLRLQEKVNFSHFVRPICLPVDKKLRLDNFEHSTMQIVGWGETETAKGSKFKLKTLVRVQNQENCKNIYRNNSNIVLGDTQICAGGESSINTCYGDFGGSLIYPEKFNGMESYFLIGVASGGPSPCGQESFPAVYTRLASFIDWIKITIKK